ncbi:MAG: uracil-DNA glycosylase family protein [Salinirussus sp.]
MEFVADTARNPFGMDPPCERFVPGYGDPNADFHVIGDHPGVHGGLDAGIPFTGRPWSTRFFDALDRAGLVDAADSDPDAGFDATGTFLSYRHMCVPGADSDFGSGSDSDPGSGSGATTSTPDADDYAALEPFFDAELRAITAHVLLPVGARATRHVLGEYTARPSDAVDLDTLHGREIRGAGWLVVPVAEPASWGETGADRLVGGLETLRGTDYRQVSDLGRFLADDEPYLVR